MSSILLVVGFLLKILAIAMLIPASFTFFGDINGPVFFLFSAITFAVGVLLVILNHESGRKQSLSIKQTFILTNLVWIICTIFASLPLYYSNLDLSYTNVFFESISGLTATGATILTDIDSITSNSILIWRCMLQWLGGIGIIVVALSILPMLKIGGLQLFRTESSDNSEKTLPRTTQIALNITLIYIIFTSVCSVSLYFAGMDVFDAICHAMTAVATGGFSNYSASIGYFNSAKIEMIICVFMFLSALPYVIYIKAIHGNKNIFNSSQVKFFIFIVLFFIMLTAVILNSHNDYSILESLRYSTFNVISIITTTGFASTDYYNLWGNAMITLIFMISAIGGCTGSTSGGIKIFRFQILLQTAKAQMNQLVKPHGVFLVRAHDKIVEDKTINAVMNFMILFALCFVVISILLATMELDYITAMSATLATLANIGPGLGEIVGPAGSYFPLPDMAKWILSFAMLLGRLELFTVLILLSPYFWRK